MKTRYLEKYGHRVVDNGYQLCVIRPGEKRPFGKDWQQTVYDADAIDEAIQAGRGGYGVGVKTALTPMVDIDCYDEDLIEHMVRVAEDLCGATLRRTGLAPKTGLVYRAKKPFRKTQSPTFLDDEGRLVKLEVLGEGQQFVAYHIHPDTEQPYRWADKRSLIDVPRKKLPEITEDDAVDLVAEFVRQANKRGWVKKSATSKLADRGSAGRNLHFDDPFISDKPKVDLSPEQLLKKLHSVPGSEDYDTWFQIGMALHHQFDGSDEGLMMWHEWSASASNYDMDVLDEKWPTFAIEGKKREPVTARLILKLAKEEEDRLSGEEFDSILEDIESARDHRGLQSVMDQVKHIAFPPVIRESIVVKLRDQVKKVTGTPMPVAMIRKQCAFENPDNRSTPAWLRDWAFVQHDECFYQRKTRQVMTTKAFDLSFGRFLLSKKDVLEGASTPEHSASHVAVHRYQIPVVANMMYVPREEEFFEANKLLYVNSYSSATVPEDVPDRLSKSQLALCQRIEAHTAHLFANSRDRRLLLSWLAYIVQTDGKINWSPVLQGVENDGKSFFGRLMAVVLGGENVNTINGDLLAEKYSSWAEGCQLLMIEEVRLHGPDRYAVINRLKTYVANDMVSVRRMRSDSYKVINTVNYLLTTNYKDGVPVNENSSRYFPMFSKWQTKAALRKFNEANPDYYAELHEVLTHPGAVRRWFLDYELHEDFNPVERAGDSSSLKEMQYLNQTEEEEGLAEILNESDDRALSWTLVNSLKLQEAMQDRGIPVPYGQAWKRLMAERGFTPLGKVKIGAKSQTYWSQEPTRFMKNDRVDTNAIRTWIEDDI